MKKYLLLFLLMVIVFGAFTISTAKIETPFDGNDTYGFPFKFYKIYGGKHSIYQPNEFLIFKLISDIIIAAFISFGIIIIVNKIKQKKKSRT